MLTPLGLKTFPVGKGFLFQQNLEMEWPINAYAAQPRGVKPVYFTTGGLCSGTDLSLRWLLGHHPPKPV
jgi:hypothetical protein